MSDTANAVSPEVLEARRAAQEARAARDRASPGAKVTVVKDQPKPAKDPRTDAQLTRDLKHALHGVFKVITAVCKVVFKKELPPLTDEEALDGATAWLPIARRFSGIAIAVLWIAAPVWVVITLKSKFAEAKQIEPKAPKDKK